MKVAILCNNFISWGGGIDFIRSCANALCSVKAMHNLEIHLLIPHRGDCLSPSRDFKRSLKSSFRDHILRKPFNWIDVRSLEEKRLGDAFEHLRDQIQIEVYENCKTGLINHLKKISADVVFPITASLGKDFPLPWIGYIFDYQHKYFPEFFTQQDLIRRDTLFRGLLTDSKAVIVNSKSVKDDTARFYPEIDCEVFSLPFTPVVNADFLTDDGEDICQKYQIPQRYFIMSNQFWVHKSHITAFEALAILKDKNQPYLPIVCTGKTMDDRFPDYFSNLKSQLDSLGVKEDIFFVGYISKRDQVKLLRRAAAVLQPTLFEGGPGGGAVFDAVAYRVPAVVSDIPINREIENEDLLFFEAKSAPDMAEKMTQVLQRPMQKSPSPQELIEKVRERTKRLGEVLIQAIDYAIGKS